MSREIVSVSPDNTKRRGTFLKLIFKDNTGYICIAYKSPVAKSMVERFFKYPEELDDLLLHIEGNFAGKDTYFTPMLLSAPKRIKDNVVSTPVLWADVDTDNIDFLLPKPWILVQSSDHRYHAYWCLKEPLEPKVGEELCRRIAYHYRDNGVDVSGWDLTQLLRIPLTYNAKYPIPPVVKVADANNNIYTPEDFAFIPSVAATNFTHVPVPDMPEVEPLDILELYKEHLSYKVWPTWSMVPKEDVSWSEILWNLECMCFDAGMTAEEVYIVANSAACNKYRRDGRDNHDLWVEVNKAKQTVANIGFVIADNGDEIYPELLTGEERKQVRNDYFIDRYVEWASTTTDAPPQFHEAAAFSVLSTLLCSRLELKLTDGTVYPNLWFMITGSTTLDRKSTSMDKAVAMLTEVDEERLLATDGSVEGILQALSTRPGESSMFHRDEFSGMLSAMEKKDFLAGMAEAFTRLYDGQNYKKLLRSGTVIVKEPRLVLLCGGIRSRILEHLTIDFVTSGFVPRFVFVDSDDEIREVKPVGLATTVYDEERTKLVDEMRKLYTVYHTPVMLNVGGQSAPIGNAVWRVTMTPEALDKYNELEATMMKSARATNSPDLAEPTMMRLSKSTLKAAILLAAARASPEKNPVVTVEAIDLYKAITYTEKWRKWSVMIIENAGQSYSERTLKSILQRVLSTEFKGIGRGELMRAYHLTARKADEVFITLEQQGYIKKKVIGTDQRGGSAAHRYYGVEFYRGATE